jgi:outer membrane protein OmpA-like peptidoglycan-associated protein
MSRISFKSLTCILLLPMAALSMATATAQSRDGRETVLKKGQVTESALIQSLALPEGVDPNAPKTRGFRPATPLGSVNPASAGKASMLMTFATDSAELTGDTRKMLDTLARALQSDALAGNTFRIEGHADKRGDADSNRNLSQARAEAVTDYLVTRHQITASRLVPVGKGDSEPLNKVREDAPENRRVTVVNINK